MVPPLLFPSVDNKTPATMVRRDATSSQLNTSMPQATAVAAEVIGSAALTVSTNDGDAPEKLRLVAAKPSAK